MGLRAYWMIFAYGLICPWSVTFGEVSFPRAAVPSAVKDVVVDGVLGADEWSDAAVLQRFGPDLTTPADPPVTVFIKHQGDAILVAFRCAERDSRYPRAAMRSSTGNLTLDDAVQVVLGLADNHVVQRDVLNMGGYDGAMGTQAVSADHYYQFTVNSAGASARTYNEVPLDRPRFTSAVGKDSQGWSVEMRIPLASFGATAAENQTIFFNAFRFRPPERVAWYMPGFGGYYPMPLGQITLLAPSRAKERTMESARTPLALSRVKIPAVMSAEIGYYPLSGRIVGTITDAASMNADRAVLRVSGLPEKPMPLTQATLQHVVIEISKGTQPARTAELLIYRGKKLIKQAKRDLSPVAAPEWVGTNAGQAYAHEKIPSPWRQPDVQGRTVALADKKITFGAYAMPESVIGYGEILAGPVEVVANVGEQRLTFASVGDTRFEKDGHQVRIEASAADGDVTLQTRTQLDYDGFMVVKMKLGHVRGERLSRFALRIPLKKEHARYYHRVLVQQAGALDGFGLECTAGPLWCGAEEQGLAFSYDTNPFVSTDRRRQIRLVEEADRVWMELNFVDGAGQYVGSEKIFRFFLQPTPTKPMDLTKIHAHIDWQWEGWSDYQGYPDLAKTPMLRQWSDELHARGRLGLLYSCQGLAENSPGFKEFSEELLIDPKWRFYQRAFDPGRGVPCYATCKRGPEGDLQLWGFDKLVKDAHIDGTVSDGLSIAWGCGNPGHSHGCGCDEPVTWDNDAETTIVAQRTFLKRLRGIFNESGRPFYMAAHTGGGLEINTLSLFDGYMEGEQLARYPRDYAIPPAQYVVGYSGRPWGLRTIFWEKTWRRQKGFFWSLTYALLHDNELEDSPIVREVLEGFDDRPGTDYHPYWRAQSPVTLQSATGTSKASCYLRSDAAMVIVGNMGLADDRIDLDLATLLPSRQLNAVEVISGRTLEMKDRRWSAELPAGQCVAIRIQTQSTTPKSGQTIAIMPESWKLVGRQNGVSLSKTTASANSTAIHLGSTPWADEARVELTSLPLTPEASVSLRIHHSGRLRIAIGQACLLFDSGWRTEGFVPGTGAILQPVVVHDRFVPVEIVVRDGRVDATYDGRPLCRGVLLPTESSATLALATWAGDSIELAAGTALTAAKELYLSGLGTPQVKTDPSSAENFIAPNLTDRTSWQTNAGADGVTVTPTVLNGRESLKMETIAYKATARAVLKNVLLRRNATLTLAIKARNRFRVSIGDVAVQHDGVWSVGGPLNGWSQGQFYQIPIDGRHETLLTLSLRDGLLNATLGSKVLVRDMQFDLAADRNPVVVETWGGDSVEFHAVGLTNVARTLMAQPAVRHPVM